MSFFYIKKSAILQGFRDWHMCPVFQKFFFFFHKILMKVGYIAASMCNYNFAKFHQYLM